MHMQSTAGKLRHRLTAQHKTQVQDQDTGEIVESWLEYCTVWADVSDLSTKDQIAAQASQSDIRARALVRYSAITAAIDTTMRVLFEGYYYRIDGQPARDLNSRREYLTINLSSGDTAWNNG